MWFERTLVGILAAMGLGKVQNTYRVRTCGNSRGGAIDMVACSEEAIH